MIGYFVVAFLLMPVFLFLITRTDIGPPFKTWEGIDWLIGTLMSSLFTVIWPFSLWGLACWWGIRSLNTYLDEKDDDKA
jgi:hypothetical protein